MYKNRFIIIFSLITFLISCENEVNVILPDGRTKKNLTVKELKKDYSNIYFEQYSGFEFTDKKCFELKYIILTENIIYDVLNDNDIEKKMLEKIQGFVSYIRVDLNKIENYILCLEKKLNAEVIKQNEKWVIKKNNQNIGGMVYTKNDKVFVLILTLNKELREEYLR